MDNILIDRQLLLSIKNIFQYFSVLMLTGPRQSGKTTLCRKLRVVVLSEGQCESL